LRSEKGTLLASGFIAGGALMGVVSVALKFGGLELMNESWADTNGAQWVAVLVYLVLIGYFIWDSMRAHKQR
jgi:hypothetical protein